MRWLAILLGFMIFAMVTLRVDGETPTIEEAKAFVEQAEQTLLKGWIETERAVWLQNNFITHDTEILSAEAQKKLIATTMELAKRSTRFDPLDLPYDVARKIHLLKTSMTVAAPGEPDKQAELTRVTTAMESLYGKGRYCPEGEKGQCLDLNQMSRIMAESRDPGQLLEIWSGWRTVSPPMREMYQRFVELANEGVRELGFTDLGVMWRAGYDMTPEEFSAEVERLWEQVRPLYEALHCHVRARLAETYGEELVPADGRIPAHLLGNMWSQSWGNISELVGAGEDDLGFDLNQLLRDRNLDALQMVRYGERFFTSLGFQSLPKTFWERSLFTKPADREVVCHASAWDIDQEDDLRIKMCIEITGEDFQVIHHELGHNFYQRAYKHQPPLYRGGANDGFHEGIGDTIALSITPEYLVEVGLLNQTPGESADPSHLMRMALDKIAFLPFGLVVDQWRWKVFSGEIGPDDYNRSWWDLRKKYQGITPPVPRREEHFDPGAKFHIPFNTPYTRYFLAHILQFQFHRALCRAAGHTGPLHGCSIYKSKEAGARVREMLQMGRSRPWREALEALTGEREMDASAILEYFAPLKRWLDEQNQGRKCGW